MGMRRILEDVTRKWLDTFKAIMIQNKQKATNPAALVYPEDGRSTLLVFEWNNDDERNVVMGKLKTLVKAARIHTVIFFGTAPVIHMKGSHEVVQTLFGTILQPGTRPFTVGYEYALVNDEPVFAGENTSAKTKIAPWPVLEALELWPDQKQDSPKPLTN